jgi:sulfate transport system ATP-binding protein
VNVEAIGLHKIFRGVTALDRLSLKVAPGELLALLGPSGSGKTTLLRVLAGLEFADAGRVLFDGRDMSAVPARERNIGFVFQNYALFRHMNVVRNVAFGLMVRPRARRPDPATIRARVTDLLDLMGIPDLGGRMPEQLSGGQRQRVALARALATDPGLLLLDEPFGALDAQVRKNLRRWLRELHDRMGLTTVLVTHDQAEAMEMADRVAVMRSGRIEQVGAPEQILEAPASPFVYEFLGDCLRFTCIVRDGMAHFDPAPLPPLPTDCPDGRAVALIRQHEIGLETGHGPAQVEKVLALAPLTQVRVRLGAETVEVSLPASPGLPRPGEPCALDLRRARLYPADSAGLPRLPAGLSVPARPTEVAA